MREKSFPCGGYSSWTDYGYEYDCSYGFDEDCSECVLCGGGFDPRTGKKASGFLRRKHKRLARKEWRRSK